MPHHAASCQLLEVPRLSFLLAAPGDTAGPEPTRSHYPPIEARNGSGTRGRGRLTVTALMSDQAPIPFNGILSIVNGCFLALSLQYRTPWHPMPLSELP